MECILLIVLLVPDLSVFFPQDFPEKPYMTVHPYSTKISFFQQFFFSSECTTLQQPRTPHSFSLQQLLRRLLQVDCLTLLCAGRPIPAAQHQNLVRGRKKHWLTWTWHSPTMENTAATVVQPTIAPPTATEPGNAAPIKVEPSVPPVVQPTQQPPQVAQKKDIFQNDSLLQPRTSQQKLAIPTGPCEARNKLGYVCFFATIHNVAGKPVAVRGNALDTKELLELIYKHLSDSQKLHLKSCVHRVHSLGTPDRRAHVLARLLSSRVYFYCSVDTSVHRTNIFSHPPFLLFLTPAHHPLSLARARSRRYWKFNDGQRGTPALSWQSRHDARYFNPLDVGPSKMLLLKSNDGAEATKLPEDFYAAREVRRASSSAGAASPSSAAPFPPISHPRALTLGEGREKKKKNNLQPSCALFFSTTRCGWAGGIAELLLEGARATCCCNEATNMPTIRAK